MITWNRPPFTAAQVVAALLDWRHRFSVEQLEEGYAEAFDVPHAILLPSGRAGIDWALRAAVDAGVAVLCSAFTCKVVHEAIVRSGRELALLDVAPGEFLMDPVTVGNASSGRHALVLCEMYGHTYDLPRVASAARTAPATRILDMAMTVPSRSLLRRLAGNDFGVISFGIGKCMYAEWGGMGFTRDASLAEEVRRSRNACRVGGGVLLAVERTLRILLRTAVSMPEFFTFSRKVRSSVSAPHAHKPFPVKNVPAALGGRDLPAAWKRPSTYLDRKLIEGHLRRSEWYSAQRLALAARYHENLRDVPGIIRPPRSEYPLSHYTIRVSAGARSGIQSRLRKHGIAAGMLFEFPRYLSPQEFPNASVLASEVMNLPLSVDLSPAQVDHISSCVTESVARAGCSPDPA